MLSNMPELPAAAGWGACAAGGSGAGVVAGAAGVICAATVAGGSMAAEPGALSAAWHMPAASSEGSKASACPRETSLPYTGDFSDIVMFMIIYSELQALNELSIANNCLSILIFAIEKIFYKKANFLQRIANFLLA